MFVIREIEDTLPLNVTLIVNAKEALEYEIQKKYINKVLPQVGLCIKIFDILFVGEGIVYPANPHPFF